MTFNVTLTDQPETTTANCEEEGRWTPKETAPQILNIFPYLLLYYKTLKFKTLHCVKSHTPISLHTHDFNSITQIWKPSPRPQVKSSVLQGVSAWQHRKLKNPRSLGSNRTPASGSWGHSWWMPALLWHLGTVPGVDREFWAGWGTMRKTSLSVPVEHLWLPQGRGKKEEEGK